MVGFICRILKGDYPNFVLAYLSDYIVRISANEILTKWQRINFDLTKAPTGRH